MQAKAIFVYADVGTISTQGEVREKKKQNFKALETIALNLLIWSYFPIRLLYIGSPLFLSQGCECSVLQGGAGKFSVSNLPPPRSLH